MINECGAVCGMRMGRGTEVLCLPQVPRDLGAHSASLCGPRHRKEVNINIGLREAGVDWIQEFLDEVHWRSYGNNPSGAIRPEISRLVTVRFSRTVLHGEFF
jgi:hypothetical protein